MRKNSLAIRIPQITYQVAEDETSSLNASPPRIETPSGRFKSRENMKTHTPSFTMIQLTPQRTTRNPGQYDSRKFNYMFVKRKKDASKKANQMNVKSKFSFDKPRYKYRNIEPVSKKTDYFDLFLRENDISSALESELFPKDLNERYQSANTCKIHNLDWGENDKRSSKKRCCQKNKGSILNSPSGWMNRLEESMSFKGRLRDANERPYVNSPRVIRNKYLNKN